MTHPSELKEVRWYILGWGLAISAGAFLLFDAGAFAGAVTGAALSLFNWTIIWSILHKSLTWQSPATLALVLVLKTTALLGVAAAAVLMLPINAAALAFGVSSLFLGLTTFGLRKSIKAHSDSKRGS